MEYYSLQTEIEKDTLIKHGFNWSPSFLPVDLMTFIFLSYWRWKEVEVAFLWTNWRSIVITNFRQPPSLCPALHSIQLDNCARHRADERQDRDFTTPHAPPISINYIILNQHKPTCCLMKWSGQVVVRTNTKSGSLSQPNIQNANMECNADVLFKKKLLR